MTEMNNSKTVLKIYKKFSYSYSVLTDSFNINLKLTTDSKGGFYNFVKSFMEVLVDWQIV